MKFFVNIITGVPVADFINPNSGYYKEISFAEYKKLYKEYYGKEAF